jgi:hypothetical protein
MVSGSHPRRKADLLAPFTRNGRFLDLTVEAVDESVLTDSAWTDYERDGDSKALAAKHALFFRSVFMASLASALTRVRTGDAEALTAFGDRLEDGLKRRLAKKPAAMHSFVHTIVLVKQCSD